MGLEQKPGSSAFTAALFDVPYPELLQLYTKVNQALLCVFPQAHATLHHIKKSGSPVALAHVQ